MQILSSLQPNLLIEYAASVAGGTPPHSDLRQVEYDATAPAHYLHADSDSRCLGVILAAHPRSAFGVARLSAFQEADAVQTNPVFLHVQGENGGAIILP